MARICEITGRKTISGNKVSHANNKTKRKFIVNLQKKSFYLDELGEAITLRVSTQAMRTIDKNGLLPTLKKAKQAGTLSQNLVYLLDIITSFQLNINQLQKTNE